MNRVWGVVGAVISVIGVITMGALTYRGTRAAARINAARNQRQVDLSVLQASVERLEKESAELPAGTGPRPRRAVVDQPVGARSLRGQVTGLGGTPQPPPQDVEDYYRTGV